MGCEAWYPLGRFHIAHGFRRRICKACVRTRAWPSRQKWLRSAKGIATTQRNIAKNRGKPGRAEYMRSYRPRWAAAHAEALRESRRRYKASLKGLETEAAYKARLRGAEVRGHVDPKLWSLLVAAYDEACAYCRVEPGITRDHIIPLSLGGAHVIENLVPACRPCNSRKHAKGNIVPMIPLRLRQIAPDLYAGLVRTIYGNDRRGVRLVS